MVFSLPFFLIINSNNFYLSKNRNGIWYKKYCNKNYILLQLKCFVKLLSHLWWEAQRSFNYSYIIFVQLNTLEICQNIKMNDPYKPSRLGLLDTGGKYRYRTYLKKVLVTTTDNNELFCLFYLWLHLFHLHFNLNAFFEGGIFIVSITVTIRAWL